MGRRKTLILLVPQSLRDANGYPMLNGGYQRGYQVNMF